jgi:hypothetical protein
MEGYAPPGYCTFQSAVSLCVQIWFGSEIDRQRAEEREAAASQTANLEHRKAAGENIDMVREALRSMDRRPGQLPRWHQELLEQCIVRMRDGLCLGKLVAFYKHGNDRTEFESGFWEREDAIAAFWTGRAPWPYPDVPIWFRQEQLEQFLGLVSKDDSPACTQAAGLEKPLTATSAEEPTATSAEEPEDLHSSRIVRRRGPRPEKLLQVKAAMIAHGNMSDLADMTEPAMEAQFGASRDTCRRARNAVLSEFQSGTNPDKLAPSTNSDRP